MRDKPSSKARATGYDKLHSLFSFLEKLLVIDVRPDDEDRTKVDHWGWKLWVIRHIPISKRGGPSEHKPK